MTASKLIKTGNATIAVTANAEILFMPGGQVYGWTRRLGNAVQRGTEAAAPTNKRPRWGHYGAPLKNTITSATPRFRNPPSGPRVYAAVGSSSAHAAYVDQGTGIFNGGSPWKAKILPPWAEGAPSLYEATWHPPGQTARHNVMIKGQRPQRFFDAGLQRGFQQMRMRSYQRPGVDPRMGDILRTWPKELENFSGNTPVNAAFIASLNEWRAWRDFAFDKGRVMGPGFGTAEHARRRERRQNAYSRRIKRGEAARFRRALLSKQRSQERRDRIKAAKSLEKPKPKKAAGQLTRAQDKARVKALAIKRFGASNVVSIEWQNGRWEVVARVFTIREGDGRTKPEYKVFHIKARST